MLSDGASQSVVDVLDAAHLCDKMGTPSFETGVDTASALHFYVTLLNNTEDRTIGAGLMTTEMRKVFDAAQEVAAQVRRGETLVHLGLGRNEEGFHAIVAGWLDETTVAVMNSGQGAEIFHVQSGTSPRNQRFACACAFSVVPGREDEARERIRVLLHDAQPMTVNMMYAGFLDLQYQEILEPLWGDHRPIPMEMLSKPQKRGTCSLRSLIACTRAKMFFKGDKSVSFSAYKMFRMLCKAVNLQMIHQRFTALPLRHVSRQDVYALDRLCSECVRGSDKFRHDHAFDAVRSYVGNVVASIRAEIQQRTAVIHLPVPWKVSADEPPPSIPTDVSGTALIEDFLYRVEHDHRLHSEDEFDSMCYLERDRHDIQRSLQGCHAEKKLDKKLYILGAALRNLTSHRVSTNNHTFWTCISQVVVETVLPHYERILEDHLREICSDCKKTKLYVEAGLQFLFHFEAQMPDASLNMCDEWTLRFSVRATLIVAKIWRNLDASVTFGFEDVSVFMRKLPTSPMPTFHSGADYPVIPSALVWSTATFGNKNRDDEGGLEDRSEDGSEDGSEYIIAKALVEAKRAMRPYLKKNRGDLDLSRPQQINDRLRCQTIMLLMELALRLELPNIQKYTRRMDFSDASDLLQENMFRKSSKSQYGTEMDEEEDDGEEEEEYGYDDEDFWGQVSRSAGLQGTRRKEDDDDSMRAIDFSDRLWKDPTDAQHAQFFMTAHHVRHIQRSGKMSMVAMSRMVSTYRGAVCSGSEIYVGEWMRALDVMPQMAGFVVPPTAAPITAELSQIKAAVADVAEYVVEHATVHLQNNRAYSAALEMMKLVPLKRFLPSSAEVLQTALSIAHAIVKDSVPDASTLPNLMALLSVFVANDRHRQAVIETIARLSVIYHSRTETVSRAEEQSLASHFVDVGMLSELCDAYKLLPNVAERQPTERDTEETLMVNVAELKGSVEAFVGAHVDLRDGSAFLSASCLEIRFDVVERCAGIIACDISQRSSPQHALRVFRDRIVCDAPHVMSRRTGIPGFVCHQLERAAHQKAECEWSRSSNLLRIRTLNNRPVADVSRREIFLGEFVYSYGLESQDEVSRRAELLAHPEGVLRCVRVHPETNERTPGVLIATDTGVEFLRCDRETLGGRFDLTQPPDTYCQMLCNMSMAPLLPCGNVAVCVLHSVVALRPTSEEDILVPAATLTPKAEGDVLRVAFVVHGGGTQAPRVRFEDEDTHMFVFLSAASSLLRWHATCCAYRTVTPHSAKSIWTDTLGSSDVRVADLTIPANPEAKLLNARVLSSAGDLHLLIPNLRDEGQVKNMLMAVVARDREQSKDTLLVCLGLWRHMNNERIFDGVKEHPRIITCRGLHIDADMNVSEKSFPNSMLSGNSFLGRRMLMVTSRTQEEKHRVAQTCLRFLSVYDAKYTVIDQGPIAVRAPLTHADANIVVRVEPLTMNPGMHEFNRQLLASHLKPVHMSDAEKREVMETMRTEAMAHRWWLGMEGMMERALCEAHGDTKRLCALMPSLNTDGRNFPLYACVFEWKNAHFFGKGLRRDQIEWTERLCESPRSVAAQLDTGFGKTDVLTPLVITRILYASSWPHMGCVVTTTDSMIAMTRHRIWKVMQGALGFEVAGADQASQSWAVRITSMSNLQNSVLAGKTEDLESWKSCVLIADEIDDLCDPLKNDLNVSDVGARTTALLARKRFDMIDGEVSTFMQTRKRSFESRPYLRLVSEPHAHGEEEMDFEDSPVPSSEPAVENVLSNIRRRMGSTDTVESCMRMRFNMEFGFSKRLAGLAEHSVYKVSSILAQTASANPSSPLTKTFAFKSWVLSVDVAMLHHIRSSSSPSSKDPPYLCAIPYTGKDLPSESSRFSDYDTTVVLTLFAAACLGRARNANLALPENHVLHMIREDVMLLSTCNDETLVNERMQDAIRRMRHVARAESLEQLCRTEEYVKEVLRYICVDTLQVSPFVLKATPHTVLGPHGPFKAVLGITGTLKKRLLPGSEHIDDALLEASMAGRVFMPGSMVDENDNQVTPFVDRARAFPCVRVQEKSVHALSALKKWQWGKGREEGNVLIDAAGFFLHMQNVAVCNAIARGQPRGTIRFTYRDEGTGLMRTSGPEEAPSSFFYFDVNSVTGTDVRFHEGMRLRVVLTVDSRMSTRDLAQALGRMRQGFLDPRRGYDLTFAHVDLGDSCVTGQAVWDALVASNAPRYRAKIAHVHRNGLLHEVRHAWDAGEVVLSLGEIPEDVRGAKRWPLWPDLGARYGKFKWPNTPFFSCDSGVDSPSELTFVLAQVVSVVRDGSRRSQLLEWVKRHMALLDVESGQTHGTHMERERESERESEREREREREREHMTTEAKDMLARTLVSIVDAVYIAKDLMEKESVTPDYIRRDVDVSQHGHHHGLSRDSWNETAPECVHYDSTYRSPMSPLLAVLMRRELVPRKELLALSRSRSIAVNARSRVPLKERIPAYMKGMFLSDPMLFLASVGALHEGVEALTHALSRGTSLLRDIVGQKDGVSQEELISAACEPGTFVHESHMSRSPVVRADDTGVKPFRVRDYLLSPGLAHMNSVICAFASESSPLMASVRRFCDDLFADHVKGEFGQVCVLILAMFEVSTAPMSSAMSSRLVFSRAIQGMREFVPDDPEETLALSGLRMMSSDDVVASERFSKRLRR